MNTQIHIPSFIYGTAWKEDASERLTHQALEAGFLAIDTANQRKHYYEEGVGKGIQKFLKSAKAKREDIFIQTKFTHARGQDHRKPYDESASYALQVKQSFASSLQHLSTEYLDSYILHGLYSGNGVSAVDWEVWETMAEILTSGKAKFIGVSNISIDQLTDLIKKAKVKPHFVQNRCYASLAWDKQIRELCLKNKITYQGFSLLTANHRELGQTTIRTIAEKHQKTIPQIIFRFSQQLGMLPLTGTTNADHMKQDLDIYDFMLTAEELSRIENITVT